MYDRLARPDPDAAAYTPFPDEIASVEAAWGEPIPDQLERIGGVDWWSWAQVEMTIADGKASFHGEYRDCSQRYRGPFLYRHPQGAPLPAHPFTDYVMTHLSEDAIVFSKDDDSTPRDYFLLEPADPRLIERR
jgi:hypothetical protein